MDNNFFYNRLKIIIYRNVAKSYIKTSKKFLIKVKHFY